MELFTVTVMERRVLEFEKLLSSQKLVQRGPSAFLWFLGRGILAADLTAMVCIWRGTDAE